VEAFDQPSGEERLGVRPSLNAGAENCQRSAGPRCEALRRDDRHGGRAQRRDRLAGDQRDECARLRIGKENGSLMGRQSGSGVGRADRDDFRAETPVHAADERRHRREPGIPQRHDRAQRAAGIAAAGSREDVTHQLAHRVERQHAGDFGFYDGTQHRMLPENAAR
jgi:hypothetical protein